MITLAFSGEFHVANKEQEALGSCSSPCQQPVHPPCVEKIKGNGYHNVIYCVQLSALFNDLWHMNVKPRQTVAIGQFRVVLCLFFKARLGAQAFICKWVLFAWEQELIWIWKAVHQDSFWKRDTRRLENGLFLLLIIFTMYADNQQTVKNKAGQIPPTKSAGTWLLEPVEQDF